MGTWAPCPLTADSGGKALLQLPLEQEEEQQRGQRPDDRGRADDVPLSRLFPEKGRHPTGAVFSWSLVIMVRPMRYSCYIRGTAYAPTTTNARVATVQIDVDRMTRETPHSGAEPGRAVHDAAGSITKTHFADTMAGVLVYSGLVRALSDRSADCTCRDITLRNNEQDHCGERGHCGGRHDGSPVQ